MSLPKTRPQSSPAALLRSLGLRATPCRLAIISFLKGKHSPKHLAEIHAALGARYDLATIFRNLREFHHAGLVSTHDMGDRKKWFSLTMPGSPHKHYLRCTLCGETREISQCLWHDADRHIAQKYGYRLVSHKLEFTGICPGCTTVHSTKIR